MLDRNVARLRAFMKLADYSAESAVFNVSADNIHRYVSKVDAIITSPPYVNAMNYPMTHRYENILLGLLDPSKKRDHEREYFGSERVSVEEYGELSLVSEEYSFSKDLNMRLKEIFNRERKRSYIAYKFFFDMHRSLAALKSLIRRDGHIVLVAGRNTIKGIHLPTFEYLSAMLTELGLSKVTEFDYEIYKQALKITRHQTADLIGYDGVAVFKRTT